MKIEQIVIGSNAPAVIEQAAKDLRLYLKKLFRLTVPINSHPRRQSGVTLSLGNPGVAQALHVSDQGYVLRFEPTGGREVFQIAGGSPVATAWGAYELAEFWGVRYLLYQDLLPTKAGPLRLPAQPMIREPLLRLRGLRTFNDFYTPCRWPLSEYQTLLDQLVKLRVNTIMVMQYPDDPCFHLEWRGAAKQVAATNYGLRIPIARDAIGYELFEKSGDAARGEFANPNLDFHKSYRSTIRAGRRFFNSLCTLAHDRGIRVTATVLSDFSWPIKKRLVEVTNPKFLKASTNDGSAQRYRHALEPPTQIIRYGLSIAGATKEMGRCMSIRNPRYLDLMRCAVQTYVDAFASADYLLLTTAEFRPSAADASYAWDQLDKKYKLSRIAPFKAVAQKCRERAEVCPVRSSYELRADICMLWLYDHLINEHPPQVSQRGPRLVPGRLSVELNRFMPRIFPEVAHYVSWAGYLPPQTIKQADMLDPFTDGGLDGILWINLEDDNVGIVPQNTGPSTHAAVKLMQQKKLAGFYTRQFLQSKILLPLNYLFHASWDRNLTLPQSYRHLFTGLCGPHALRPLMRAIGILTRNTDEMYEHQNWVAFMSPQLVASFASITDAKKTGTERTDAKTYHRYERIRQQYAEVSRLLAVAAGLSRAPGRGVVDAMRCHAEFASFYMAGRTAMCRASDRRIEFVKAEETGNIDRMVETQDSCRTLLGEAKDHFIRATEAWAAGVEDRCDLGVLAGLNHYVVKATESLNHLASLEDWWARLP